MWKGRTSLLQLWNLRGLSVVCPPTLRASKEEFMVGAAVVAAVSGPKTAAVARLRRLPMRSTTRPMVNCTCVTEGQVRRRRIQAQLEPRRLASMRARRW